MKIIHMYREIGPGRERTLEGLDRSTIWVKVFGVRVFVTLKKLKN
jgi:hypothetical protein